MAKQAKKIIATLLCLGIIGTSSVTFATPIQDRIGTDKIAHAGAGYLINNELGRHTKMSVLERNLAVLGLAVGKELLDKKFDSNDIIATMLGSLGCSLSGKF